MQQNREPRDPNIYGQIILDKGVRNIQWEKSSSFNNDIEKT